MDRDLGAAIWTRAAGVVVPPRNRFVNLNAAFLRGDALIGRSARFPVKGMTPCVHPGRTRNPSAPPIARLKAEPNFGRSPRRRLADSRSGRIPCSLAPPNLIDYECLKRDCAGQASASTE